MKRENNKEWITYSLALYTCSKGYEQMGEYVKAYEHVEKAFEITKELVGTNTPLAQKYSQFKTKLSLFPEVKSLL